MAVLVDAQLPAGGGQPSVRHVESCTNRYFRQVGAGRIGPFVMGPALLSVFRLGLSLGGLLGRPSLLVSRFSFFLCEPFPFRANTGARVEIRFAAQNAQVQLLAHLNLARFFLRVQP